jgi:SSS family solute:Na+ symporter
MLLHFFPTGILGLGLTALLASFMSGMAGNVTAFNTVWTYDIYQAYINKKGTDAHYLWMGRMATIGGIVLSIGAAYAVTSFNNIMDALQLVFSWSTRRCSRPSCWACSGSGRPAMARLPGLIAGTGAALCTTA